MSTAEGHATHRTVLPIVRTGTSPVGEALPYFVHAMAAAIGSTESSSFTWNVRDEAMWLASGFAVRARELSFVRSIWQVDESPRIVVFVDDETGLDEQLSLHTLFAELASELNDPGIGDLVLRGPENEADTALFVRRLHPT